VNNVIRLYVKSLLENKPLIQHSLH